MRFPFLLSILVVSLSGCSTATKTPQVSADQMVDGQIAQSANALSLAQLRLHQTSAASQASSLTGPAPAGQPPQLTGSGGVITSPQASGTLKALAPPPAAPPAKVVVVEVQAPMPKPPLAVAGVAKTTLAKTTPVSAVPPAVVPNQGPWVVSLSDVTLRRVLVKWATKEGWQLSWDASVDVPVTVSASLNSDFKSAVKLLFLSLSTSDVNLKVVLYTENRVLRVTESGQRAQ